MTTPTIATPETESLSAIPEQVVKNFRTMPEIEAFYRFVHENDMRREALIAMTAIVSKIQAKRKKNSRANAKKNK